MKTISEIEQKIVLCVASGGGSTGSGNLPYICDILAANSERISSASASAGEALNIDLKFNQEELLSNLRSAINKIATNSLQQWTIVIKRKSV